MLFVFNQIELAGQVVASGSSQLVTFACVVFLLFVHFMLLYSFCCVLNNVSFCCILLLNLVHVELNLLQYAHIFFSFFLI